MKQTHFTNKTFFWIFITLIGLLMLWNLYASVLTSQIIGLLPIIVQGVLLVLILTKNQYAKIAIKIWVIAFLIIASGMKFIGRLLQDFADNFEHVNASHYIVTGFTILVGIVLLSYVNKTVKVIEIEK